MACSLAGYWSLVLWKVLSYSRKLSLFRLGVNYAQDKEKKKKEISGGKVYLRDLLLHTLWIFFSPKVNKTNSLKAWELICLFRLVDFKGNTYLSNTLCKKKASILKKATISWDHTAYSKFFSDICIHISYLCEKEVSYFVYKGSFLPLTYWSTFLVLETCQKFGVYFQAWVELGKALKKSSCFLPRHENMWDSVSTITEGQLGDKLFCGYSFN